MDPHGRPLPTGGSAVRLGARRRRRRGQDEAAGAEGGGRVEVSLEERAEQDEMLAPLGQLPERRARRKHRMSVGGGKGRKKGGRRGSVMVMGDGSISWSALMPTMLGSDAMERLPATRNFFESQEGGGGDLLAGLASKMENMKLVNRIKRVLKKPSFQRTETDVNILMKFTESIPTFSQTGTALHKDLCYSMYYKMCRKGDTVQITETDGGCNLYIILNGEMSIKVRYKHKLAKEDKGKGGADQQKDNSEKELKKLFDSIDTDGSGEIDVDELMEICQRLGVTVSDDEVKEMMESADSDGNGVLDFEEFMKVIEQFGIKKQTNDWEEVGHQLVQKVMVSGTCFGEDSLQGEHPLRATLHASEHTDLMVLHGADFMKVIMQGEEKIETLKSVHTVQEVLTRSDIKPIAYATQGQDFTEGQVIVREGKAADSLYFIVSGECKVVKRLTNKSHRKLATHRSWRWTTPELDETEVLSLKSGRSSMEVSIIGTGNFFGEEALSEPYTYASTVVAKGQVQVLILARKDAEKALHQTDIDSLQRLASSRAARQADRFEKTKSATLKTLKAAAEYQRAQKDRGAEDGEPAEETAVSLGLEKPPLELPIIGKPQNTLGSSVLVGTRTHANKMVPELLSPEIFKKPRRVFMPALASRHATMLCRKFYEEKVASLSQESTPQSSPRKSEYKFEPNLSLEAEHSFTVKTGNWAVELTKDEIPGSGESTPPPELKAYSRIFGRGVPPARKQTRFPDSPDDRQFLTPGMANQSRPSLA